jgi:hypothetical protein
VDLRRLDDRVVARAAAWARRVRGNAAAGPGVSGLLRALDDRYASTGALRVVRDEPGLGVLAAVSVLLAGAGTSAALALSAPPGLTGEARADPVVLGAPVGVDAEAHLASAQERAVQLTRETPDTRRLALVSLRDELTAEQAARLVVESSLALRRAYVRAPVAGPPELFAVDLAEDPARTLTAFAAATAGRKAQESRELQALAAAETGQPEVRASYEAAARTAGLEAAAYAAGCACVMALVVEGPAAELAEFPSLPVVRGVEVAPPGTRLTTAEVTPLPPEVTGPVPAAAGGG